MLTLVFLCFVGFLAAIIDSIAGGGGMLTIPSFLLCGVPPHIALGTNKFCASCSSITSSLEYAYNGKVNYKLFKILAPFSLIGAILGVNAVLNVDPKYLNIIVVILLIVVGSYSLFSKEVGTKDNFQGLNKKNILLGILLILVVSFYNGFFGPGTGSFLIFGIIAVYKFDFVHAGGNSRALSCLSNVTSVILFAFNKSINYKIAIPMAVSMIIGAKVGTHLALHKGSKLIKPIFITMSLLMAIKILYKNFI
ncbi:hypothetical protein FDF74_00860 [Clostridium niameyense]|uniref:Probable membrane transporter protein n=1 Tax=Clostridium niameyense TaxID=1622073 RepID=A0A6M0R6E4_9CLOT|nr:TSUP family transporter [Clostridium niameyense]NEZ45756.1 hypothetical protein [Clostridium niameyense]